MKRLTVSVIALALAAVMLLPIDALAASNIGYISGVTSSMCEGDYWANKSKNADEVIMTADEIERYNEAAIEASGTNCFDVEDFTTVYDGEAYAQRLIGSIEADYKTRKLYIGDELLDNRAYFDTLKQAVNDTCWKNDESGNMYLKYGVCTKQANVMALPTDDVILYSTEDPDSEYQLGALKVNDAVVIKQKCDYQGETFYYVLYNHLFGWVNSKNIAICASREEWLDSWKVDVHDDNFIVVTQDKIVTEPSIKVPSTNEVKLTIGAVLKLVPEDEIPANIGERNRINNYVVYLPTRDENGNYVKQAALISQHYDVSVGFLPMTERNVLKVAFSCLGNRYGWSGMLDSMDCSLYARDIYRCFGMSMPRNTTWQQNVPGTRLLISQYSDEEKMAIIEKLPIGSLLYFYSNLGHVMVYLGTENKTGYVISDTGSLSDPEGELNIMSTYSVIVNPLTARRRDETSWLSNLESVIIPANFEGEKFAPQKGWLHIGDSWSYVNNDGTKATGWAKLSGKWYFFDSEGVMQTGWVKDGGKWYYLKPSGAMATGWVKDGGKWYYLKSSGAMATGWLKDGGKWYYLNTNGTMRTANLTYKGKVYKFNISGVCLNP